MADLDKKFSIESWIEWSLILKWGEEQLETTRESLVDALVDFPDSDKILAEFQEKKLAKKKEQYEKLEPVWFKFAPKSAQLKREELKNSDNVEKLQRIHNNVSYNPDHTMNIIKLNKTFCEDVSGAGKRCNWEDAKKLAESKWYTLPSDYNDCDPKDVKENSDWYKVINIFSNGNWDTIEGMKLFRDMAWCNDRYWTATEYTDNNFKGVARFRLLDKDYCYRDWNNTDDFSRVCGLKDSM